MKIFKRFIIAFGIIFLLLFIFLAATIFIATSVRIKDLVEHEIEQDLGINVTISQLSFSPALAHIAAQGITVHNPEGFQEKELAYINALHFTFDPIEVIVQKKPSIYLCAIDIERLNVVRNSQGKINIKEIIPQKDDVVASETRTPFYFRERTRSLRGTGQQKKTPQNVSE